MLTGAPGKGKTALIAHLVEEEFGRHAPPPVHFFYRRTAGITDPDVCLRSLYHALLEAHDITEAEESRRQDSPDIVANKLIDLLHREIAPRLQPGRPQLIFIDDLDEGDRDAIARVPAELPAGVFVIASTRPALERGVLARRPHLEWFDLDDPGLQQEDLRDGLEFVRRKLAAGPLPEATLDEVARLGAGNFLVLTLLCRHLRATLAPEQVAPFLRRLATDGRQDQLGFIYEEFWQRITGRCTLEEVDCLCGVAGVLTEAHAPLPRDVICDVLALRTAGWELARRRLAEYLIEQVEEEEGVREEFYRIYHESFADFLRAKLTTDWQRLRDLLATYVLVWARLPESFGRTYALQFGPRHLVEAGRVAEAATLLQDLAFLEAKTEAGFVFDLVEDFGLVARALPGAVEDRRILRLLEEALRRDLHFIARHPTTLFQCLWNRCWWHDGPEAAAHHERPPDGVAREGLPWSAPGLKIADLVGRWRREKADDDTPGPRYWVRLLRPPADPLGSRVRAVLRGHDDQITGLAVSRDGGRLVSGSADKTVRVWDVQSGREVLRIEARDEVNAVAFSPDDQRIGAACGSRGIWIWDARRGTELIALDR